MSQDVVPAREVAALAAIAHQPADLQPILDMLDAALAGLGSAFYSSEVQHLLQQSWAVAGHTRNRQVTIHHLASTLAVEFPEAGKELAEYLDCDVDELALGCVLKVLSLGEPVTDRRVLPPAVATVRWLHDAVAAAGRRGSHSDVRIADLAQVVQAGDFHRRDRKELRAAAQKGRTRYEVVLGPRSGHSLVDAPASSRDVIKHVEKVQSGRDSSLLAMIEEIDERHSAALDNQRQTLSRIETALPRPPSGARLTAAILAVLALGTIAGVALTLLQPHSQATQAALTAPK